MNKQEEYSKLTTVKERAEWLLKQTIIAKETIDPETMDLVYRAEVCGWILPGFHKDKEGAITQGKAFLNGFVSCKKNKAEII